MPTVAPTVLVFTQYSLRHVGPKATIWPASPAVQHTVLSNSTMVARPLPANGLPSSPDFVSGSWTGRLGDAGEVALIFPNAVASDGQPWRSRFDPTGHLQWLEVYDNNELEMVGVIDVTGPDQQQVQVHAFDGLWLLKKGYTRDWICVAAPRNAMQYASSLWTPMIAEEFVAAGAWLGTWTFDLTHSTPSGSIAAAGGNTGGVILSLPANETPSFGYVTMTSPTMTLPAASSVWRSIATVPQNTLPKGNAGIARLRMNIIESSGDIYGVTLASKAGQGITGALNSSQLSYQASTGPGGLGHVVTSIPKSGPYTLQVESDGRWVWAFVNGQLISVVERPLSHTPTTLKVELALIVDGGFSNGAFTATVSQLVLESQTPFLQSAADPGDYVLPGDQTTYPTGGLHGRYYNDMDLAADTDRLVKVLSPNRSSAYAATAQAEYQNQLDPKLDGVAGNPSPGAQSTNWSAVWFGAIYLKMSAGNYSFSLIDTQGCGARVWIGDTSGSANLLDQWAFGTWGTQAFTLTQAHVTATKPYGQGTVVRDGWYPIKIEFHADAQSSNVPKLVFTNIPASYTDPGGTSLTAGAQAGSGLVVPATSLSPLGCVDNRYQAISHFDMVQQVAQAYGYQFSVEPKQLEATDAVSGLSTFPGVLAPRLQEGTLTDVILEADDLPRNDGEGILNYSNQLDATDIAGSMWGNGAGIQSGNGSLQSVVFDVNTMLSGLFDVQGWQDFSDASESDLLQALLNTSLTLRLSPWQVLAGDPMGRPRFAYSWPLPSSALPFRWRPGDGLMIHALRINVWDGIPRQMLQLQRSFTPEGLTGSTATFAQRPKGAQYQIMKELYKIRRWQRNYQHQLVTLSSDTVEVSGLGAGAQDTNHAQIALSVGDQLVGLTARVTYNSGPSQFSFAFNNNDVQNDYAGAPWNGVPVNIDLTQSWARYGGDLGAKVQIINKGGSSCAYNYQILADVLR